MEPLILAIDTSCDETSAAVTCGHRVLSNIISSQINIHKKYGGVFPSLAKRAHEERIDFVVQEAIRRASIVIANQGLPKVKQSKDCFVVVPPPRNDSELVSNFDSSLEVRMTKWDIRISSLPIKAVAVTQGPGLAIALEVGIKKAKELVKSYKATEPQSNKEGGCAAMKLCSFDALPLIAIDHMEGHIYSTLAQNAMGNPEKEVVFPALCLLVSGGHTELVLMKDHGKYQVLGSTLDDACGEALDKAAKILKLGYPGGPIIEQLALQAVQNSKFKVQSAKFLLTPPLKAKTNLNFSYSGLKTQFLYLINSLSKEEFNTNLLELAYTFQSAAFEQLIRKTANAIKIYRPRALICGGGVLANKQLRKLLRKLAKENNLPVFFPTSKKLNTDNAAMIGVAAYYKFLKKEFVKDINLLDRIPRLSL